MKKNIGYIVGFILCLLFSIGFSFALLNCIQLVDYFDITHNEVHHRILTYDKYEMSTKSDNYEIYFNEYDKPFHVSSITQKKLNKKELENLQGEEKVSVYYTESNSDKYDFVICEMKTDDVVILNFEDFVSVNKNNQIIGIVVCSFMVLDGLFLSWVCMHLKKMNDDCEERIQSNDPKVLLGKVKIEYEFDGHLIQVYNMMVMCSLVIDDKVVDRYAGIVSQPFTLKGMIRVNNEDVAVEAKMGHVFMRLYCNGQLVDKKFMAFG